MRKLESFEINVGGTWLSDLWFNFGHDHWQKIHGDDYPSESERRDATDKDAVEFMECCGMKPEAPENAEFRTALVEDFLKRV